MWAVRILLVCVELDVFIYFDFFYVFVFKMDRGHPGAAWKTLTPSKQTLKSEARTLDLLYATWEPKMWATIKSGLAPIDWARFLTLSALGKVRFSLFSFFPKRV